MNSYIQRLEEWMDSDICYRHIEFNFGLDHEGKLQWEGKAEEALKADLAGYAVAKNFPDMVMQLVKQLEKGEHEKESETESSGDN